MPRDQRSLLSRPQMHLCECFGDVGVAERRRQARPLCHERHRWPARLPDDWFGDKRRGAPCETGISLRTSVSSGAHNGSAAIPQREEARLLEGAIAATPTSTLKTSPIVVRWAA